MLHSFLDMLTKEIKKGRKKDRGKKEYILFTLIHRFDAYYKNAT